MSRLDTLAANDSSPQQWACDRSSLLSIGEFRRWPLSILSWPLAGLRAAPALWQRVQPGPWPRAHWCSRSWCSPLQKAVPCFQSGQTAPAAPHRACPAREPSCWTYLRISGLLFFFFCLFAKNVKCNLLLADMFWSWIRSFLLHVFSSARPWGVHINGFVQLQLEEVEEFRMIWWHHSLKAIL